MARTPSNLICKCGRKGGFLTKRKAGYLKKNEYYYVGHYDRSKKGRTWCSISMHDLAHLQFDDIRYHSEYLPLIRKWKNANSAHAAREEKEKLRDYAEVLLLKIYKGKETIIKPFYVEFIIHKTHADFMELYILEQIESHRDEGITTDHNVLWRWYHDLPVTQQRLWCNHPHYKNWPKRKSRRHYIHQRIPTNNA